MIPSKLKWTVLAIFMTGIAFTSAVVIARQDPKPKAEPAPSPETVGKALTTESAGTVTVDSLPSGEGATTTKSGRSTAITGVVPTDLQAVEGKEEARILDRRTIKIIEKLEEPISMSFAKETSIDDVLKYVKRATTTPTYSGIPIYVDPLGLQEAERSINSTVTIDLEGVPLRRTLQLVLRPIGLGYFVEDGVLVVTSEDSVDYHLPALKVRPTLLKEKMEKGDRGELPLKEMEDLIKYLRTRETLRTYESLNGCLGITFGETPSGDAQAKAKRDAMEPLLKEVRELIELLKAERQAREAPMKKKSG